jgi:hypothetical protein
MLMVGFELPTPPQAAQGFDNWRVREPVGRTRVARGRSRATSEGRAGVGPRAISPGAPITCNFGSQRCRDVSM